VGRLVVRPPRPKITHGGDSVSKRCRVTDCLGDGASSSSKTLVAGLRLARDSADCSGACTRRPRPLTAPVAGAASYRPLDEPMQYHAGVRSPAPCTVVKTTSASMRVRHPEPGPPLGSLPTGEPYFAPIGEMLYDGDLVRCQLCGRWLKMVGGQHPRAAHELTIEEYREMAPGQRFDGGTRDKRAKAGYDARADLERRSHTTGRPLRAVGADRGAMALASGAAPDLAREWHPTSGAGPIGITAGNDGAIWFTVWQGGKIGRLIPSAATPNTPNGITEFTPPPTPSVLRVSSRRTLQPRQATTQGPLGVTRRLGSRR
jgi:hypothetical protein